MNELMKVFQSPEFGEIRTAMIEGRPYAVGVDVARALGYQNPSKAVLDHCKGDFLVQKVTDGLGREQETRMIPEGDMYRLIVAAASQGTMLDIRQRAERFEHWVFDEVLPEIRRTGSFQSQPQPMTQIQILQQTINVLADQERRLAATERTLTLVKDTFAAGPEDWRNTLNSGIRKIAKAQNRVHQLVWDEFYILFDGRAHCDLTLRLKNLRERMIDRGVSLSKIEAANRLDAIGDDPRLVEIALHIIKEMVAKYAA